MKKCRLSKQMFVVRIFHKTLIYGLSYSSIMGRGTACLVEDVEEKKKAMSILMKTQTGKDFSFEDRLVSIVTVIRVDVAEYTAKHRPLPEIMR